MEINCIVIHEIRNKKINFIQEKYIYVKFSVL